MRTDDTSTDNRERPLTDEQRRAIITRIKWYAQHVRTFAMLASQGGK